MADRAKTLITSAPAVSSISASSFLGGFPASNANDKVLGVKANSWINDGSASYPEWVRYDFGAAVTIDRCLIAGAPDGASYAIKDGGIEYSTDDVVWTSAYEFLTLYNGGGRFNTEMQFTPQTARYWRVRIDAGYGGAGYIECEEFLLWDSTKIGARLDNGGSLVLTAPGATTASASTMASRIWGAGGSGYGLHWSTLVAGAACTLHVDLGSVQYIGGLDINQYGATGYWPAIFYLYTSTDGVTWTYAETVTLPASSVSKLVAVPFSRVYSTRYIKFIPIGVTTGLIWVNWYVYATLTPAAPPDPTSVTARASATGTNIELTWSEIAGDDNLLADIVFDITRQKDGGGYASIATGVVGLDYVDTFLAAGVYDYKVQARNLYHARTSSAVQSSASVTSPAAAGGGGAARSGFAGAGMRVS